MRPLFSRLAALAVLVLSLSAAPLRAQDVTLTARDGSLSLPGTLLQYDGEFYRIDTRYGPMTLAADGVRCSGPGCPGPGDAVARVAISGARQMGLVLMPAFIEGYARQHGLTAVKRIDDETHFSYTLRAGDGTPVAEIAIRASTTDEGIADLVAAEADLALALRPVTAAEAGMAREAGIGELTDPRRARIVGLDALVAVVAPENPVTALTVAELSAIFSGEIRNWRDLGGPDAPVIPVIRAGGAGQTRLLAARFPGAGGITAGPHLSYAPSAPALSDRVAADPFAIGLVSYSEIGNTRPLAIAGACGFRIAPDPAAIKAEDYPLTERLRVYTPARRLPRFARQLLAYLETEAAQALVPATGFVGQAVTPVPLGRDGQRLAKAVTALDAETGLAELREMLATRGQAQRLSAGFRFEDGTATLDPRAEVNVRLLGDRIAAGRYDGKTLIFAGFSDSAGGAAVNLRLSRDRAAAARDAVLAAAGDGEPSRLAVRAVGFGELSPIACDDSDWGRRLNRRVEVWLADQR